MANSPTGVANALLMFPDPLSARAFGLGGGPDPTGTWPSGCQVSLANGNVLLTTRGRREGRER